MKYLLILLFLVGCSKESSTVTGQWVDDDGVIYSFFDDSRFKQSDIPGQWLWEESKGVVKFYGTPDREWRIVWVNGNEVEVTESVTFTIRRL